MCFWRRRYRSLHSDLLTFVKFPIDGIVLLPTDPQSGEVLGLIVGPAGTPYANGLFPFEIKYPMKKGSYQYYQPRILMKSDIQHPDLVDGEMEIEELADENVFVWTLETVLEALRESFAKVTSETKSKKRASRQSGGEKTRKKGKKLTKDSGF